MCPTKIVIMSASNTILDSLSRKTPLVVTFTICFVNLLVFLSSQSKAYTLGPWFTVSQVKKMQQQCCRRKQHYVDFDVHRGGLFPHGTPVLDYVDSMMPSPDKLVFDVILRR